jgi:hypothetical protein
VEQKHIKNIIMSSSSSTSSDDYCSTTDTIMALDQIASMQEQEERHYNRGLVLNSLRREDDELVDLPLYLKWRSTMIHWNLHLAETCRFETSTIEIATYLSDQFVAARTTSAATNAKTFQLASMACLYIAIKTHEEDGLTPRQLETMGRGRFVADDILDMERKVLMALKWRVNPPTASAAARLTKKNTGLRSRVLKVVDAHIALALVVKSIIPVDTFSVALTALHMALHCCGVVGVHESLPTPLCNSYTTSKTTKKTQQSIQDDLQSVIYSSLRNPAGPTSTNNTVIISPILMDMYQQQMALQEITSPRSTLGCGSTNSGSSVPTSTPTTKTSTNQQQGSPTGPFSRSHFSPRSVVPSLAWQRVNTLFRFKSLPVAS